MPGEARVSVIMAVLNAERYLRPALESVAAQTLRPDEIIVVDGGSTDGTEDIVRAEPSARWITQGGAGLADAWNTGLAAATGSLIAFQDSDDFWSPDKLALQVGHLESHPEAQYVLGNVQLFVEAGQPPPPTMRPEAFERPYPGRMPGTLLARRAVFDIVGPFDPSYGVTVDMAWFAKLDALALPGAMLPEVLLYKRHHNANYSIASGPAEIGRHLPRMLKQALDARRARPTQEGQ